MLLLEIFTKYAQFVPLSHSYKVHIVAQLLMDNVIKLNGHLSASPLIEKRFLQAHVVRNFEINGH
jgi:hypothetical protein